MASPVSSIRSAARGTYSAYKRQPIRWRLAGGSAALTLVILLGFAVIVGTLTTQAIYTDFNREVSSAADRLQAQLYYQLLGQQRQGRAAVRVPGGHRPRRHRRLQQRGDPRRHRLRRAVRERAVAQRAELRPAARGERGDRRLARGDPRAPADEPHRAVRHPRLRPVRPPDLGRPRHRQPGQAVPRPGRARRRRARAAGRPGHRAPGDGADRGAHRGRARDRAHARPDAQHPAAGGRRRGRRALVDARVDAARTRRGPHGDRGDARAPARVRRRRLARAAHAAHVGAGQPRAARGDAEWRAARGGCLRAALQPPDAPAGGRPAVARARRRRPRDPAPAGRPGQRRRGRRVGARARRRRPRDLGLGPVRRRDRRRAGRVAPAGAEPDGERAAAHRSRAPRSRRRSSAATARWCWRSRTTGRGFRPICRRRSSSASSAPTATVRAPPGSGCRSSGRSPRAISGKVALEPPLDGRGARFVVRFPAKR